VALFNYQAQCGALPTEEAGFKVLFANPGVPGWGGPYLEPGFPLVDQWGTRYRYKRITEQAGTVGSAGPDRKFGTGDDILYGVGVDGPVHQMQIPKEWKGSAAE
jgi:hypothetical protein